MWDESPPSWLLGLLFKDEFSSWYNFWLEFYIISSVIRWIQKKVIMRVDEIKRVVGLISWHFPSLNSKVKTYDLSSKFSQRTLYPLDSNWHVTIVWSLVRVVKHGRLILQFTYSFKGIIKIINMDQHYYYFFHFALEYVIYYATCFPRKQHITCNIFHDHF